ncbi:MAG: hypothetical protein WBO29_16210 [Albidovulum sp.]
MTDITETSSQALRYGTADLFETDMYPIDSQGSDGYAALLARARNGLNGVNCAQLTAFIRPRIVARMQAEAEALAPTATYTKASLNPYFSEPPKGAPEGHPLRRFALRRHGMVRAHRFSRNGVIWSVFQNPDLCRFVADALGYDRLYTYRDPYASVNINVQPEGCEFAWHFDNNVWPVERPVEGKRNCSVSKINLTYRELW